MGFIWLFVLASTVLAEFETTPSPANGITKAKVTCVDKDVDQVSLFSGEGANSVPSLDWGIRAELSPTSNNRGVAICAPPSSLRPDKDTHIQRASLQLKLTLTVLFV